MYASLATDVYNVGDGNFALTSTPSRVEGSETRDRSFYGQIYKINDGNYIVAIRGTDDNWDWLTNIDMAFPDYQSNYQYQDALALAHQAQALAVKSGGTVSITGHSLGGALAAVERSRIEDIGI